MPTGYQNSSKLSPEQVIEKFKDNSILARCHTINYSADVKVQAGTLPLSSDTRHFAFELEQMNRLSDDSANEIRAGNRCVSTTLLVPGLDMHLFDRVGFLHDADQCTIRGYMYTNAATIGVRQHDYLNINSEKEKFENFISRKDFANAYSKKYPSLIKERNDKVDALQKRYESLTSEQKAMFDFEDIQKTGMEYNEVLANIYPDSLCGIVVNSDSSIDLLSAMHVSAMMKSKGIELPIFHYQKGKVQHFELNNQNLAELFNHLEKDIPIIIENEIIKLNRIQNRSEQQQDALNHLTKLKKEIGQEKQQNKILTKFCKQMGYEVKSNKNTEWEILPENIKPVTLEEIKRHYLEDNSKQSFKELFKYYLNKEKNKLKTTIINTESLLDHISIDDKTSREVKKSLPYVAAGLPGLTVYSVKKLKKHQTKEKSVREKSSVSSDEPPPLPAEDPPASADVPPPKPDQGPPEDLPPTVPQANQKAEPTKESSPVSSSSEDVKSNIQKETCKKISEELKNTESSYLKYLNILNDSKDSLIQSAPKDKRGDLNQLLNTTKEINSVNSQLEKSFNELHDGFKNNEQGQISKALSEINELIPLVESAHTKYANLYSKLNNPSDPNTKILLDSMNSVTSQNANADNLSAGNILIMPIQRTTRYPMLLDGLCSNIEAYDNKNLKESLEQTKNSFESVAGSVNATLASSQAGLAAKSPKSLAQNFANRMKNITPNKEALKPNKNTPSRPPGALPSRPKNPPPNAPRSARPGATPPARPNKNLPPTPDGGARSGGLPPPIPPEDPPPSILPEAGPPENLPPPIPEEGPPEDLPPPIPQEGPPDDLPPPIPKAGPPEDLPPLIPQEGPPPDDLPPPIPEIGPPEDLPPPIPEEGPPEDFTNVEFGEEFESIERFNEDSYEESITALKTDLEEIEKNADATYEESDEIEFENINEQSKVLDIAYSLHGDGDLKGLNDLCELVDFHDYECGDNGYQFRKDGDEVLFAQIAQDAIHSKLFESDGLLELQDSLDEFTERYDVSLTEEDSFEIADSYDTDSELLTSFKDSVDLYNDFEIENAEADIEEIAEMSPSEEEHEPDRPKL